MKITTNNHSRPLLSRHEVPKAVLKGSLDWVEGDHGFLRYQGTWYHLGQFLRYAAPEGWDGVCSESATSGVLIRLSDDGESYTIASFRCLS